MLAPGDLVDPDAIAVLSILVANKANRSSTSRVRCAPGRAKGTASTTTTVRRAAKTSQSRFNLDLAIPPSQAAATTTGAAGCHTGTGSHGRNGGHANRRRRTTKITVNTCRPKVTEATFAPSRRSRRSNAAVTRAVAGLPKFGGLSTSNSARHADPTKYARHPTTTRTPPLTPSTSGSAESPKQHNRPLPRPVVLFSCDWDGGQLVGGAGGLGPTARGIPKRRKSTRSNGRPARVTSSILPSSCIAGASYFMPVNPPSRSPAEPVPDSRLSVDT